MFQSFVKCFVASAAMLCGLMATHAQDCACNSPAPVAHVDDCGCGSGSGGSFLSHWRHNAHCHPGMKSGLWDGYCQERRACDYTPSSHHGWGLGWGCGLGCGLLGGCGTDPCGCENSCFTPAAPACGCGHLFGGASCFRRDGHFFHHFRKHDCGLGCDDACVTEVPSCGCDTIAPACGCDSVAPSHGCSLFRKPHLFHRMGGLFHRGGTCGCGHCDCIQPVATPTCGTNSPVLGQPMVEPQPSDAAMTVPSQPSVVPEIDELPMPMPQGN